MSEYVLTERKGRVLSVTLNRPEKKNALTHAMYTAMGDALVAADADADIRVLYFTGSGNAFTAGNDLGDFASNPPLTEDAPVHRFLRLMSSTKTPIVVGVNGFAVGVGLTMLLHSDLVYAADTAFFQAPFVDLALVPEAASSLLLPATVGRAKAAEIFYLGERVSAAQAEADGLITRCVPADELPTYAFEKAEVLAQKAPKALALTKKLTQPDVPTIQAKMDAEAVHFAGQLQSPEVAEAIRAFQEKRKPNFG